MRPTPITPDFSVSPQIAVADLAGLKDEGYRSVVCNRPDREDAGQPDAAVIQAEAERLGLVFAFVPVVSGGIGLEDVAALRETLASLPAPVLAYCRSGTRSRNLHALAQQG